MDNRALMATLDDLPVGVAVIRDGRVEWQNTMIRNGIATDPRDPEVIHGSLAALGSMQPAGSDQGAAQMELGGTCYYVGVHASGESALVLLMPGSDSETPFPEIVRLRQLCQDLEEIFRHSFDGIFVADGRGKTLMVNEGCERNYDLKAADMIGRHVSEFEQKGWIRSVVAQEVARTGQRISTTQHTHAG